MITTVLQGPPGTGKSQMLLTYPNPPLHIFDLDRKIATMASFSRALASGAVTYDEFTETIAEESLADRLTRLAKDQKPSQPPRGWAAIASMIESIPKNSSAMAANCIAIDSWSFAVDHILQSILYSSSADKANAVMNQRQWGQLMQINKEAITVIIDICKKLNKDLIITVHERVSEVPGPDTRIIKGADGERSFIGQMNMKIAASIPGQFGIEMGRYFTEYYGLSIKMENDKPVWKCRVLPDGKRDLRTSFDVKGQAEWECDFRKIWGKK